MKDDNGRVKSHDRQYAGVKRWQKTPSSIVKVLRVLEVETLSSITRALSSIGSLSRSRSTRGSRDSSRQRTVLATLSTL